MMLTLLVMTDGRADCLARSVASYDRLHGPITDRVIHDDSGDPAYRAHLTDTYHGWTVVSTGQRSGFAGAYRSAWQWLRSHGRTDWVFSTEDDFVIADDVDLDAMVRVMAWRPYLCQMALLRQPWNDQETAAGGIVAMHPGDYADCGDGNGHHWLTHRRHFTTNPHLVRRSFILDHDWPQGTESEGRFGIGLFADSPAIHAAYWGRRDDPPRVEHIGLQRVGTGY